MILGAILAVALLVALVGTAYLNLQSTRANIQLADALDATTEQLVDAIVANYDITDLLQEEDEQLTLHERNNAELARNMLDSTQHAVEAVVGLRAHQSSMNEMGDQIVAMRKQVKAVLHDQERTALTAKRVLDKQYRQQRDVDDILYWAKQERGELNG